MNVLLIRHTAPQVPRGVCYGQSDVGTDEDAYAAALAALQKKINDFTPDVCYTSPLLRCARLARDLSDLSPVADDRLKELNFGRWELKRWDDIEPQLLAEWGNHFDTIPCPGGESFEMLQRRIVAFWEECTRFDHKNVLVVTHAGTIRALIAHVLGMPLNKAPSIRINYASISAIACLGGQTTVTYINR